MGRQLHETVIRFITQMYNSWAPRNLRRAINSPDGEHQNAHQDANLSRSEEIRIMRAVYQCETYYHLFGRKAHLPPQQFHFPILDCIASLSQHERRQVLVRNARDEAETRRDPIEFAGNAPPLLGPPAAWVMLWGGVSSNIYGGYVPETLQQGWGTAPELVKQIEDDYQWRPAGW
ncbi:hypothetical protein C8A05DRAFT_31743 [Staphylotrichum tortipilum]|uniref:Uncharacterized protein n=1 Tax=Staphylotrichum tortipilum TaxID=2831512 RepID=A0AAN6MQ90_9PEZI|nr:hypothetical protein C8A05DRAFT_31743 [Staphylotrichum longicolle]